MKTLNHSLVQEWILCGRILDPEEAAGLSEHLVACAECRQFAAFQKELLTSIPRIAPVATHSESELRQKTAVVQARLKERNIATRFFHGTRAVALVFSAVALVVLLGFVIVRLIPEQARLTPGGLAKTPTNETAAPSTTPAPSLTPMASATVIPAEFQSFLKTFPLVPGTQWIYADTEYDPDPSDPAKTIQAVFEITETVVEVKISGSDYLAHLERKVSAVSADPAWSGQSHSPAADSEWWYIVHAGQVFSSLTLPADLQAIDFGSLMLEFQFPLAEGGRWCPSLLSKGNLDPAAPTVEPCANDIGARLVQKADVFQSAAGTFPTCYLLEDVYNTGNILQTFCEGVGIVAHKFDHAGTRFGFSWALTGFHPGASGGETATLTPTPVQAEAAAQPLTLVSQRGGAVSGLALQGSTAYVGIGPRLAAVDVSDPAAPRLLAESPALPGAVSGVLLFPATPKLPAAVVGAGRYVEILSLGEADKITLLDEVALPGTITSMALDRVNWKLYVGGFIYQAYDPASGRANSGFAAVIDLMYEVRLGQIVSLTDPVSCLALTNNMLYAALGGTFNGVVGVPLTAPDVLGLPVAVIPPAGPNAEGFYSMQAAGNRLYVGTYSAMIAYDISNPAAPSEKWRVSQDDAGQALMMVQGFVLLPNRIDMVGMMPSGGYGGFWQASFTPPEAVPAAGDYENTSKAASSGTRLYIAQGELDIFDTADPKAFKPLGAYHPPLYATIQQITRGDLVYTLDTDPLVHNWPQALHVLRLPDLQTVSEYAFQSADDAPTWEYFSNMALEGDRLYLFDMHKGTWVFDLTDPLKPALLNRPGALNETMRSATAVKVGDRRLVFISIQAESGNSLAVYDVTDLGNIQQLSSLDLKNESAKRLAWSGSALFAVTEGMPDGGTNPQYWFYAINLENDSLRVQLRTPLAEDSNLAVQGDLAALASPQKLVILSVTNPAQPKNLSETELPGSAINIAFKSSQLFLTVSSSSTQLMVFDLSDPSRPRLVSNVDIPFADFFTVSDPYIVMAGISSGIEVLK